LKSYCYALFFFNINNQSTNDQSINNISSGQVFGKFSLFFDSATTVLLTQVEYSSFEADDIRISSFFSVSGITSCIVPLLVVPLLISLQELVRVVSIGNSEGVLNATIQLIPLVILFHLSSFIDITFISYSVETDKSLSSSISNVSLDINLFVVIFITSESSPLLTILKSLTAEDEDSKLELNVKSIFLEYIGSAFVIAKSLLAQ